MGCYGAENGFFEPKNEIMNENGAKTAVLKAKKEGKIGINFLNVVNKNSMYAFWNILYGETILPLRL